MSALKDQLTADLTAAMRARDETTLSTLRMLKTAITKAEVAGDEAVELGDAEILTILASEAKKRAEAATMYEQGGRGELAEKERAEAVVIQRYLPTAMSDDELATIVRDTIARTEIDASNPGKSMGAVVKAVREQVGQQADGGRIAAAVKAALAS